MKNLLVVFTIFSLSIFSQGASLDPGLKNERRISLQGLQDIKHNLERELKSLVSPINFPLKSDSLFKESKGIEDDLMILPSILLNMEVLEKLGLAFLNKDSFSFRLDDKKIIIPREANNIFIFNTSDSLSIPNSKHHNFAKFIDQSLPFNLPEYMNLINYYLVLPRSYVKGKVESTYDADGANRTELFNYSNKTLDKVDNKNNVFDKLLNTASIYSRSVLQTPISDLPIFRSTISEDKPLMVFMFANSEMSKFEKLKNPIMSIKNYLTSEKNIRSNFFDSFAQRWIKTVNYDSLIASKFCTTNSNNLNDSYCLQIHNKRVLYLFPAFKEISELLQFEKQENDNDTLLEKRGIESDDQPSVDAQAIRQAHDKISSLADKVSDVTYELATEPKPLIERVDERLDQKMYKIQDKIDEKKDNIDDKKDNIIESLMEKIDGIKSKLGFIEDYISDDKDLGDNPYNVDSDNLIGKRKRDFQQEEAEEKVVEEEHEEQDHPKGGLVLPLALIRTTEEVMQAGRNKRYSQVVFDNHINPGLVKRFSIFSKDEQDCENITWFNVFHRSIFGKPKFCINK